jgi:uncharacterized repeat protein (TIGR01451 family)
VNGTLTPTRAAEDAPNAAPELSVTKVGTQPNGAGLEGPTVFTITFRNLGTAPASGVILTERIPVGTDFEPSMSTPGWNCDNDVCDFQLLEPMPADASGAQPPKVIRFALSPNATLPATVDRVTNTVQIGDDGTNGADSTPTNNSFTAVALLGTQADLVATMQATLTTDANSDGRYAPGDVIAYQVTITNTGTRFANNVRLSDVFNPALGVQVVNGSVSASKGTFSNTATSVGVLFGTLAPSEVVNAAFQLTGTTDPPLNVDEILHQGDVSDIYGFNTSTSLTAIPVFERDIAISSAKSNNLANQTQVKRGELLTYTIVVTNTGSQALADLKLVDEVNDQGGKAQCIIVNQSTIAASKGTVSFTQPNNRQRIEISFGSVASSETVTVSFQANVRNALGCANAFNQATLFNGTLLLGDTNLVSNPVEPPQRVYLPAVRR